MHRPMLRALKLSSMHENHPELSSDASPDVEGIETPAWAHAWERLPLSDASPDVEGIETEVLPSLRRRAMTSDASPDVEGIETNYNSLPITK